MKAFHNPLLQIIPDRHGYQVFFLLRPRNYHRIPRLDHLQQMRFQLKRLYLLPMDKPDRVI